MSRPFLVHLILYLRGTIHSPTHPLTHVNRYPRTRSLVRGDMAAIFLFVIKKLFYWGRQRKSSSPSLWAPGGARYGQGTSMVGPVRGPSVPIESRFGR